MKLTVDRISEGIAVLEKEDMSHIQISSSLLPSGTKEGTVLYYDGKTYMIDKSSEEEIRNRIIQKQRSVFRKK